MASNQTPLLVEFTAEATRADMLAMGIKCRTYANTLCGPQAIVLGDGSLEARLRAKGYRVSAAPAGYYIDDAGGGVCVREDGSVASRGSLDGHAPRASVRPPGIARQRIARDFAIS
jgi:hypothetical protein